MKLQLRELPKKIPAPVKDFASRFHQSEITTRAAALAYHSLLAIVPVVGLFFWYLTNIGVTDKYLKLSRDYIISQIDVGADHTFVEQFDRLTATVSGSSWGWIGVVLLVYTAANLIVRFGESLDIILDSAPNLPKMTWSSLKLSLRRIFVMLGMPVALTLSLVVTQWIRSDSWFHLLFKARLVGPYLALSIPVSVDVFVLFLIYHFIPRKPLPARQSFKAALVVGPLFEITHFGVGVYNGYAVSVHKIYGVLAVIPMVILWVQVAWILILSGALLVRFEKGKRPTGRKITVEGLS